MIGGKDYKIKYYNDIYDAEFGCWLFIDNEDEYFKVGIKYID